MKNRILKIRHIRFIVRLLQAANFLCAITAGIMAYCSVGTLDTYAEFAHISAEQEQLVWTRFLIVSLIFLVSASATCLFHRCTWWIDKSLQYCSDLSTQS